MVEHCHESGRCAFCHLPQDEWETLDRQAPLIALDSGATLLQEGTVINSIRLLCSGLAKLSLTHANGRRLAWTTVNSGEAVGLAPFLAGEEAPYTVTTHGPCLVRFVSGELTCRLLNFPQVYRRSLKQLSCHALDATVRLREAVLSRSAEERLARLLIRNCLRPSEATTAPPAKPLPIRMTVVGIAEQIGTSRETASRLIAKLVAEGVLQRKGRILLLRDPDQLRTVYEA
jgi:CRP/FNR family transcriptional regulator, cyclic AMP receptor protein